MVCVNYAQNLNRIADLIVPSSRTILEFHVPPRNAHVNLNVSRCLLKKIYIYVCINFYIVRLFANLHYEFVRSRLDGQSILRRN